MRRRSKRTAATYGVAWPSLSFKDAKLIVSFGADFLDGWGASVPQQLDFADARAKLDGAPRFVYIGPRRSLTGLNADEWIACKPGSELAIANALAGKGSIQQAATDSGVDRRRAAASRDRARRGEAGARPLRCDRRQRARRRARRRRDQSGVGRGRHHDQARAADHGVRRHRDAPTRCSPRSSACARGQVGIAFVRGTNPAYSASQVPPTSPKRSQSAVQGELLELSRTRPPSCATSSFRICTRSSRGATPSRCAA